MRTSSCGATDAGKKRSNNEDAFLVLERNSLFAVADGIGGNEGGEVASRIAVDTLASAFPELVGENDRTPPAGISPGGGTETAALRRAFDLANREIRRERESRSGLSQMGTTLTALFVSRDRAFIGHIGDSRAYLLRAGTLKQITQDHSLVADQVRAGVLKPAQVRSSPNRHIITRALGIDDEVDPELTILALQQNDMVLLCTDGLTEMVDDGAIRKIMAASDPPEVAKELVKAANERGGVDNITVVVVRFP